MLALSIDMGRAVKFFVEGFDYLHADGSDLED